MVPSSAGSVVMVPFPFPDLSQTKLRPAVVLAGAGRGDWVLCQITSNPYADTRAVLLENAVVTLLQPKTLQLALAWLLKRSPVMLPIPGTSSVAHLEENVAAASLQLTDEEFGALSALSKK